MSLRSAQGGVVRTFERRDEGQGSEGAMKQRHHLLTMDGSNDWE